MFEVESANAVYLYTGAADMRMGIDRLSSFVLNAGLSPLSGALYVFVGKRRSRIKILYWDRDGYCLWFKRLEAGLFRIKVTDRYEQITGIDLNKLLNGIEFSRIKFQKESEKVFS